MSSIVQPVAPPISAIPWSPLSETTFPAIRTAEPPATWIPIRPAWRTVLPTISTLLEPLSSWMQRSSPRTSVNPSIRTYDVPDA